jgi:GNAT superfamily N-acetyltransferase
LDSKPESTLIRPGLDSDSAGFIALTWACWSQYPGIRMDVDAEMPEYRALAMYYADQGGALWCAEAAGQIVGMIATRPLPAGAWEICRVYVRPALHGGGLGHRLLDLAEAHAISAGASRLVLWSDTRFDRAHRFYEKRSYVRSGPVRVLADISNSLEYGFANSLNGIEVLDAAAAESAIPRLSDILIACVEEGAGVSFLPPLASEVAREFWRGTARDVAAGSKILLTGWADGVLAGTVTLALASPQNQQHRADVVKLLVHPSGRRHGLARRLMARLELEAANLGRVLLTLDTRSGDLAEGLYRSMNWIELGRLPDHALAKDGTYDETLFMWKRIDAAGQAEVVARRSS